MSKHRGVSRMDATEEFIDPVKEILTLGHVITRAEITAIFNQIMASLRELEKAA